jgi:RNA polymerase sigma-70 factor (ECF subfamily)
MPGETEITDLIHQWRERGQDVLAELMPLVYPELRRRARIALRRERPGHILQPTALANELYLKLVDQTRASWQTRNQFFAVAARLMRYIVVDDYRSQHADKRPHPELRTALNDEIAATPGIDVDLIDLDAALSKLEEIELEQAQIVELRFFMGMSVAETAEMLHVSASTVTREWRLAKAWLSRELSQR